MYPEALTSLPAPLVHCFIDSRPLGALRVIAKSIVLVSVNVVKQRKRAETAVEVGPGHVVSVIDERIGSKGSVLCTVAVEQERRAPVAVLESAMLRTSVPPPRAVL